MSLANLNINVTANVAPVVNAMADVKAVTSLNMGKAGESVKSFQTDFEASSVKVQQQSKQMSSEMQSASSAIGKASEAASSAIGDISASADATASALGGMSKGMDEAGKKFKEAIGPEAAEQIKSTTDRVEEFVATRVAIAAVGVALGAVAATVATVGYAAYKASGFMAGLITGESYKSANIDALIAMNKEVVDLQKNLQMAAGDAGALNDAIQRIGVDKGDFTTVYKNVESAIRSNKDELDRLGVAYTDANGKILETRQIVENAQKVLDTYTEGWDRNQAAVAIGFGSYDQLNNYLKVNQGELQKSKDRLNEYNLAIGPETQQFVDQYNKAMLEFKNETRLMGEAFKRVWADQVMPAFTTFAEALKDGWPSIVNATRHVVAAFTTMGYGIKMSFDMVWDTVSGTTKSLGGILAAFGVAAEQAMHGNFKGASETILMGARDSVNTLKNIGTQITEDANKNLKAMQLAQGLFNKDMKPAAGPGSAKKGGKPWTPAAAVEEEVDDGGDFLKAQQAAHEAYLRYLKAFEERKASGIKAGYAEEMELNKQAYESGLIGLKAYLEKKHQLNQATLQAELTSKQNELATARQAEQDARDAFAADATGDSAKVVNDAMARTEMALKAVTEAQSKLTLAKRVDAEETRRSLYEEIKDRVKIETTISDTAIQIAKLHGLDTTILENNKSIQDSKNKILLLEQSIGFTKANELATTQAQIAAEQELLKKKEQQADLDLRRGILNGSITGLQGGYNASGQWEYKATEKWKQDNPYISDADLLRGIGRSNTTNNSPTNNINVMVNGGIDAASTGRTIAQEIRNGIVSYQFGMMTPINGGYLP